MYNTRKGLRMRVVAEGGIVVDMGVEQYRRERRRMERRGSEDVQSLGRKFTWGKGKVAAEPDMTG